MKQAKHKIQILGTGKYLPQRLIPSSEIDHTMGLPEGTTERTCGVRQRYYAEHETASEMAVKAIEAALQRSQLSIDDIDCIISASGTMEQAIPCNATKVAALLSKQRAMPCFDINMTCLGALMALQVSSQFISSGAYKHIIIFASDIASVGIDWKNLETGGIFGDGAAAIVLGPSKDQAHQSLISAHFATFTEGVAMCEIKGAGTKLHPRKVQGDYADLCMFQMQGKEIYRLATTQLSGFVEQALAKADLELQDITWVVPHQASPGALKHIQKKLKVKDSHFINIVADHGNQIAASILTALHELFTTRTLKSQEKIMLLGTGAGLSMGVIILEM